jgi:T5SS/PEP-CTERM-associated repeat protein
MSASDDGDKAAQSGLVDMGDISFYNHPDTGPPPFTISDLANYPGSFSEIVLNVTWAQLQPVQNGPLDPSALIASAISAVTAYNAQNGTNVGIKLRVWGGYTAPAWAQNIDGPPITITGPGTIDSTNTSQTIGRFWTADYIQAWTSFQNQLAATYDNNPIIRGISQTAGAAATDEPFVPLKITAQVSQPGELLAGGYTDAAEMLTLRAAIADYSQWSTTPLDYTMNLFHLEDSGKAMGDANFTLAVLQQARNSTRLVQAGNHALNNPLPSSDSFVYVQLAEAAALDPATTPASYQTASPVNLGNFANWPNAVLNGVAANAGDIELWDGPASTGFTGLSPSQVKALAAIVADGSPPPTADAPDDGSGLGFIAPAFVTGAPGTVAFSGTSAVLLASVTTQSAYSVTLTSMNGGTLAVSDFNGAVIGSTRGPSLTLTGAPDLVNTVLAHLTDTLQSGTDVVHIVAMDSSGDTAVRDVGVQISPAVASTSATPGLLAADQRFAFGGNSARVVGQGSAGNLDIAAQLGSSGILLVGGVQSALSLAGNLTVDSGTSLLAALSPSAYSTASLTVGGTLDVAGNAYFSGMLGAAAVIIDSGGAIHGDGTLKASVGSISNNGTIEAVADQTLGLQQLAVASNLTGSGTLLIDPGATLLLSGTVAASQTVQFVANSIAQLSNGPYSPSTLVIAQPDQMRGPITGFSFADTLVLQGVAASSVAYDSATSTLTVGGVSHTFTLSGDLTGLTPNLSVVGTQSTITFVAPSAAGVAPSVVAPAALRGAAGTAVLVPDVVLDAPLPASPLTDIFGVTLTTGTGKLSAQDENGNTTVITGNDSTNLTLSGTLGAIEQTLQTLTYKAANRQPSDTIGIIASYGGLSGPSATIQVTNGDPVTFDWGSETVGSFGDSANWSVGTTPPGGADVASFAAGTRTVSGDGAVAQILDTGTTTLTGQVTAQGRGGIALSVDSGGALTLAGGALLSAQAQAIVGDAGQGLLLLMGGALALTGTSTPDALVIGDDSGSTGTVLDLEQITADGTVVVGGAGTGTLELLGVASTVLDGGADIGQSAGGQGSATVNGGEWATSGLLTVGDLGSGALLIDGMANGIAGQVTAFAATIGANAGSQGAVMLDGGELLVASATAASSTLVVGASGTASLAIENGSEVAVGAAQALINNTVNVNNNGLLVVGATAGGSGRVRIGGNGALLVYGNGVVGGAAGAGAVTVGESADDTALFALIGTLAINATGQVTLGGANATVRASAIDVGAGGLISGAGTLSGDGGGNDTVTLANIDNDGSILASGGDLLLYGGVSGTGTLSVATGATMTLQAVVGSSQTLAFSPNARAVLNDPHAFMGTIRGFGAGDVLELANTQATGVSWSNGKLTIATASGSFQLDVAGSYAPNIFTVQPDGLGGTDVAGGFGDVHMTTFDGLHYDLQATGEFVAVRSINGTAWQIQIRTASAPGATSITTALAAQLGDDRVTFAVGRADPVYVDGMADTALHSGDVQSFAGGTLAELSTGTYRLSWNTGESVTVTDHGISLDWSIGLGAQDGPGSVQGLLGSDSGWARDFQLPNGSFLVPLLGDDQSPGGFADAWRVTPGASLLADPAQPAQPATSTSPATLQLVSAIAGALVPTSAAPHDLSAPLQGATSPSAGDLFAASPLHSPFGA